MHVRLIAIAVVALISVDGRAAEPAKAPAQSASQPQSAPAPIVLASADDIRQQPAQQAPAPKRRIARVTTCRCGGQEANDPESQPEQ